MSRYVPAVLPPPPRIAGNQADHTVGRMESRSCVVIAAYLFVVACSSPTPDKWDLVFVDDFDTLNSSTWSVADNYSHTTVDHELQLYTKDNVYIDNSTLVLRTQYDPNPGGGFYPGARNFTSGWIESSPTPDRILHEYKPGFAQAFGRFEIRAKLPTSNPGIWPAIWMMPEKTLTVPPHLCWPAGGEIDIMETWGGADNRATNNNRAYSTYHYSNTSALNITERCGSKADLSHGHIGGYPAPTAKPIDWSQDFHVWALEWNATNMAFFVDEHPIGSVDARQVIVPQTPFYFILNTAICSPWYCKVQGAEFSKQTVYHVIDWIKAYTKKQPGGLARDNIRRPLRGQLSSYLGH